MFKKEKIKDLHYSIAGALTAAEIEKASDEILLKYGEKAKMPGFRAGHVPLSVLRQKFGQSAFGEAVDKLMNADMEVFLKEKNIRPAGSPKADFSKLEAGADVEFTVEFDILPALPDIDLDKFTLTKKTTTIEKAEVDKALANLCRARAQAEKQPAGYKAADGDVAVIDFKGFIGTEPFAGGEAKKHHLIIGSGAFIPGFEEQLIGHKTGEKFDVNVKFPKDYHAENLAGKDARFEVEIHELRHHIPPAQNDELAKAVGQESLESLRGHIEKILAEQYKNAAQAEMHEELLDILADKVKLELPECLVAQEYDMAKEEFDRPGRPQEEKWDEKKERKNAERRVKLGLILAEWGNQNGVKVDNSDLQKEIWAEASRHPNPQEAFDFYHNNPNAMAMVRGMVFERKALDAMVAKTKIKEKHVKPEELFKQSKA